MAAGDNRGYGGNSGYDDQFDAYYSWDSNVPNHRSIQVGDPVALWDKERLLGVSVVEAIDSERGSKLLNRCPDCRAPQITARKQVSPRFRCNRCKAEFDAPLADVVEVRRYRARYDAAWTSLDGLLDAAELKTLQVHEGEFNAMRAMDWERLRDALVAKRATHALSRVVGRAPDMARPHSPGVRVEFPDGFRHTLVRVRTGQRQFREHLLASQGSSCAFTGAAPERVLEAGHLYSYARLGEHHEHGGLMLRRDIHRLFDDGMLAVEPDRLRVDVAPELAEFPQYARLHDERLTLRLRDQQVDWLNRHWEEHRRPEPPSR